MLAPSISRFSRFPSTNTKTLYSAYISRILGRVDSRLQRVLLQGGTRLESLHIGEKWLEALPQFSLEAGLEGSCWFALPQAGYSAKGLDGCESERVLVGERLRGFAIAIAPVRVKLARSRRYIRTLKCKRKFSRRRGVIWRINNRRIAPDPSTSPSNSPRHTGSENKTETSLSMKEGR